MAKLYGIGASGVNDVKLIEFDEDTTTWSQFSPQPGFVEADNSTWAVSGTDGDDIVVGDPGNTRFRHYNGATWDTKSTGVNSVVAYGLMTFASNDIFCSANNSTIWHYNGTSWSISGQPWGGADGKILNDIHGSANDNVWAVGGTGGSERVAKYDGISWSTVAWNGSDGIPQGVFAVSPTNVYVATNVGFSSGRVMNWNGASWSKVHDTVGGVKWFRNMWGFDASNIWAVGANGIIRYFNGSTWATQDFGGTFHTGIYGDSASNVYVSTFSSHPSTNGRILHYNGSVWTQQAVNSINNRASRRLWIAEEPPPAFVEKQWSFTGKKRFRQRIYPMLIQALRTNDEGN